MLRDRCLAEDLVDDVFEKLLCRQQDLTDHPNIAGWLSLALKYRIYDELKSARHRFEVPLLDDGTAVTNDTYHQPLSDLLPPGLSPKEQEILILLYEEELSYEEAAQRLSISVFNCRTRAFRARARCKQLMLRDRDKNFSDFL